MYSTVWCAVLIGGIILWYCAAILNNSLLESWIISIIWPHKHIEHLNQNDSQEILKWNHIITSLQYQKQFLCQYMAILNISKES